MAKKNKNTFQADVGKSPKRLWIGIAAAVVVIVAAVAGFFAWQANVIPFTMAGGDKQVIVLLRAPHDGAYTLQYTGNASITLKRLLPMIQGPTLNMDVEEVVVIHGGQEYVLDTDGYLPEAANIVLQADDTIDVRISYLGQTIGSNRLYGFRLRYDQNSSLKEVVMELEEYYMVYVE